MSADVFLSYSSKDREDVRPIVAALEDAKLSVWWDREIGAGAVFERKIEEALDNAKCVVVVWSRDSVQSDWVRAEAHEGLARGVLAPVIIDDARPPLAFRQTHHLKIADGLAALVAEVRRHIAENEKTPDLSAHVHYITTPDNARLAYVRQGAGLPVVRALGWSTSCALELNGENALTNALVRDFNFITYDGRGGGMSARGDFKWSIEERLCDLETVIDAANLTEKFVLFGISEGSRAAILYADKYPEKVSHLVLDSPSLPFTDPDINAYASMEWLVDFVRDHWGTENPLASRMICSIWSQSATPNEQRIFIRRQRESMTAQEAARYIQLTGMQNLDPETSNRIWNAIAALKPPVLVFHTLDDPLAPYDLAKTLAETAPKAELITSNLPDHGCVLSASFARLQAKEVRRFVLGR